MQTQLDELSGLVDKAADDAEGGAGSISSSLGGMSNYVKNAADAASDLKVNIDANGSLAGQGGCKRLCRYYGDCPERFRRTAKRGMDQDLIFRSSRFYFD